MAYFSALASGLLLAARTISRTLEGEAAISTRFSIMFHRLYSLVNVLQGQNQHYQAQSQYIKAKVGAGMMCCLRHV
jgi:hypothetical protein